jgi:ABC-2 type transport system permease protein
VNRLLRAELRRISARRLVRLMVLLIGIAVICGGLLAFLTTAPLSESGYQQRVQEAATRRAAVQAEVRACIRERQPPGSSESPSDATLKICLPDKTIHAHDPRFHHTRWRAVLQAASGVLAAVAWLLGASLIGAEYQSRSLTTTLTWESRRTRVFAAKAVTAIGFATLLTAAALVLVGLAMIPAATLHGAPTAGEPGPATLAGVMLRGTALSSIAAAVGFSLATLGRTTAAALGAGFGYVIILENVLGGAFPGWRRWLLLGNTIAFLSGRNSARDVPGRSAAAAGLILLAVATVFTAMAVLAFRCRDVS